MKVVNTSIPELLILEPNVFEDERGFFFESFNERNFNEATGLDIHFVQDNHSKSSKGVLRGIHFQGRQAAQSKLVRCTQGEIFDVAVDLRVSSPTFSQWTGIMLSAENRRQFWIPKGFGHGFLVLSPTAEVQYKVDNYWAEGNEFSLRWNDIDVSIQWPKIENPIVSQKDGTAPTLKQLKHADVLFS